MRILIADKFEAAGVQGLEKLGCEVTLEPDLGPDTMGKALARIEPEILIVRSTKVPDAAIKAGTSLRGIIRAGAGTDNIDKAAAGSQGISVCNCPGMNAVAVAELATGHLINCDRRIPEQCLQMSQGSWNKKLFSKARGLKGRTLGVLGAGAIGRAIVQRALAFEMNVIAWDLIMEPKLALSLGVTDGGCDRQSLLKLLPQCDAVTLHLALSDATRHMCDREFFEALPEGAIFINTSRGGVVDESALLWAIQNKAVRAGLDVYENQPATPEAKFSCAFAGQTGVSLTHHVGASTDQAQQAVSDEVLRVIKVYQSTNSFENVVNTDQLKASASV